MPFDEWWAEVKRLAKEKNIEFLLSDDPEDHRFSYEDGDSPEYELDVHIDESVRSL